MRMTDFHYRMAERLIHKYGPQLGQPRLRTLDALQLAVALEVHQRVPLDWFVITNDNLCGTTSDEQLPTPNPVQP